MQCPYCDNEDYNPNLKEFSFQNCKWKEPASNLGADAPCYCDYYTKQVDEHESRIDQWIILFFVVLLIVAISVIFI